MEEHLTPKEIAEIFAETAVLLELKGENQFKVRAFQNAARSLKSTELTIEELVAELREQGIKGFGPQLSDAVFALYETGSLSLYENLKSEFPDTLLDLLDIPGLGAKKIKILHSDCGIDSIEALEKACREGALAGIKGFGEKTIQNILAGIERLREYQAQSRYDTAYLQAEELLAYVESSPACSTARIAGSLRRGMETVKDIDLVAASTQPEKLSRHFTSYPKAESIIGSGAAKASILLSTGTPADLRIVEPRSFPTALLHFTGSKEHNIAMRSLAKKYGLTLNEYGLFEGENPLAIDDEAAVYRRLELAFIPPELREDMGELESAASACAAGKQLPELVGDSDIRGVLHAHTTYSDGKASLKEMALSVRDRGYSYFGVTDHSRSAGYAGGLSIEDIKRQHDEIDELNEALAPFRIFKGIESDILADGSLDYPDPVLETFDFIIASIHSQLNMKRSQMTERLERAAANPYTTILGHISTRRLLRREGADIDIPRVLEAAAKHSTAVEINGNPQRLDLDWRYGRLVRELGIAVPICPDAHSIAGLAHIHYGVVAARKAGLTPEHCMSCWGADRVEAFFRAKRTPEVK